MICRFPSDAIYSAAPKTHQHALTAFNNTGLFDTDSLVRKNFACYVCRFGKYLYLPTKSASAGLMISVIMSIPKASAAARAK